MHIFAMLHINIVVVVVVVYLYARLATLLCLPRRFADTLAFYFITYREEILKRWYKPRVCVCVVCVCVFMY